MASQPPRFKKPLEYDPTLAERTLTSARQQQTEAKNKKANMLMELGLADEDADLDDDEDEDDDQLSDDDDLTPSAKITRSASTRQSDPYNSDAFAKEFKLRRQRIVQAKGLTQYVSGLLERAEESLNLLRAERNLQYPGSIEIIPELQQEIDVLQQEVLKLQHEQASAVARNGHAQTNGTAAPRMNGIAQNDVAASLTRELEMSQTLVDELRGRVSQLERAAATATRAPAPGQEKVCECDSLREKVRQLTARLSEASSASTAAGVAGTARDGEVATLRKQLSLGSRQHAEEVRRLQQQVSSLEAQVSSLSSMAMSAASQGPTIPRALVASKLKAMYGEIDAMHTAREDMLRELVAIQEELFNGNVMQQMVRLVRDKEVAVTRKLKADSRAQLEDASKRIAEAEDMAVVAKANADQQMRIMELETAGRMKQLQEKWRSEYEQRKKLHNLVLELKGSIRVLCRVRPLLEKEKAGGDGQSVKVLDTDNVRVVGDKSEKDFEFDRVFAPTDGQEIMFTEVVGLVTSVLDGYNVCIMAYGQTGSGKTYTMEGPESDPGVNSRALTELFRLAGEAKQQIEYTFAASVLEIYNEQIYDLLAGSRDGQEDKLDVKQGPDGMYVPGLKVENVPNLDGVLALIQRGKSNRSTFATNMNEHSSRSHLVLSIYVTARSRVNATILKGKLHLIDLAGSERLSRTGAQGDRLKEAQAINKSLSSLGDVIQALQEKTKHVPYRNSKLTRLLEDSLGGSAKTLMVVNVSPAAENVGETKCSLEFASRARKVELGRARINVLSASPIGLDSPTTPVRGVESTPSSRTASPAVPKAAAKKPIGTMR